MKKKIGLERPWPKSHMNLACECNPNAKPMDKCTQKIVRCNKKLQAIWAWQDEQERKSNPP